MVHLPHGNFVKYLVTKATTGTHLSCAAVYDEKKADGKFVKLQLHYEGAAGLGVPSGYGINQASRTSGTVCHTRHKFSVAEARKLEACASCHLGPDHPYIEIYTESKHGQIFLTRGEE